MGPRCGDVDDGEAERPSDVGRNVKPASAADRLRWCGQNDGVVPAVRDGVVDRPGEPVTGDRAIRRDPVIAQDALRMLEVGLCVDAGFFERHGAVGTVTEWNQQVEG